jgi:hypothetical protein
MAFRAGEERMVTVTVRNSSAAALPARVVVALTPPAGPGGTPAAAEAPVSVPAGTEATVQLRATPATAGTYQWRVQLLSASGTVLDQRTGSFTVEASVVQQSTVPAPAPAPTMDLGKAAPLLAGLGAALAGVFWWMRR